MKKSFVLTLAVTLMVVLVMSGCGKKKASDGGIDPIELTYATYVSANHYQGVLDTKMFERIEEQSGGAIKIKPYFDATLIDPKEWYQELIRGTADIAQAGVGTERDRFQLEYSVALFNYGITDLKDLLDYTHELVAATPAMAEEYKEVVPLSRLAVGQSWVHTVKKPIRSAADFKGLNLKVADEASVALVQALGANPIKLPISETYSALEKGTIDGVVTGADPLKTFKFAEVTKYSTALPYATPWINSKFMNKDVFAKLSPEAQKIIQDNFAWYEEQLIIEIQKEVQGGIDAAKAEGNEIIELTPEATAEIVAIMEGNAKKYATDLDAKGIQGTEFFNQAREVAKKYE